jgi:hypothetical protein
MARAKALAGGTPPPNIKPMKKLAVKATFTEEILGTASSDPKIHSEFIASKGPNAMTIEEEVAAIGAEEVEQKAKTIFPKEDGKPFIYDYQVKGFFKSACSALARVPDTLSSKLKAYKKVIDGTIFVSPRKILFEFNGTIGECQRPLRAQTAQGERIALANSETIPGGSTVTFVITMLDPKIENVVREWLDYGKFSGIGQWRNSGKGRFDWEEAKA